jgi:hypothetical protein
MSAQSIGAALSNALAGLVVVKAGYTAALLTLGVVAAIGFGVCWFALPETRASSTGPASRPPETARSSSSIAAG